MLVRPGALLARQKSPWAYQVDLLSDLGPFSITRNTTALDPDDFSEVAIDTARFGAGKGVLVEPQRTNKCTNYNFNPDASLTNITESAGTLDRVDDSGNLTSALSNVATDGNVFHLDNQTGGVVTITVTGQCSNTNAHSIRVFCRFTGTAPTLQLTGGDGATSCNDSYAETTSENITPSASTDEWQLSVPDGTEVWFIGNGLEEGAFVTTPIVTEGSSTTRNADEITAPWPSGLVNDFVVAVDFTPLVDNTELTSAFTVFGMEGNNDNKFNLTYSDSAADWRGNVTQVGTSQVLTAGTQAFSAGDTIALHLAIRTPLELFVDNSSIDNDPNGGDFATVGSQLSLGTLDGANPSLGYFKNFRLKRVAPGISDSEVLAI